MTAKLYNSMAYQNGAQGNPFLIVLHEPGAAELYLGKPAMDVTGRNLASLFAMIRRISESEDITTNLYRSRVSILNASPFPVYKGFNENRANRAQYVGWKEKWYSVGRSIVSKKNIRYIICMGQPASKFIEKIQLKNKIVITCCHVGIQGLNKTIDISNGICPTFQRLFVLAKFLSAKISAGVPCDWNDYQTWVDNNSTEISQRFADELKERKQLLFPEDGRQREFDEYMDNLAHLRERSHL